jgi:hypothetical protein
VKWISPDSVGVLFWLTVIVLWCAMAMIMAQDDDQ